jgi:hypothetical protein
MLFRRAPMSIELTASFLVEIAPLGAGGQAHYSKYLVIALGMNRVRTAKFDRAREIKETRCL